MTTTTVPAKEEEQNDEGCDSGQAQVCSLYVGDLRPDVTESDLLSVFGEMGQVASVRVCTDALTGKSLCYAYVNFFSPSHATKALARLNHVNLKDKPMRIMWSQRDPTRRKAGIGNLYVKNLDALIDSARLESIFSKFGTIISCKVAEENGKSKGFGFVQFDSEESALKALNALHDTTLEGKKLYVSKFVKKTERHPVCEEPRFTNLYVKNLEENVTVDLLRDKFSAYGKVSNAVIMKDDLGKSRGFGFVDFESPEDAKKAAEALNGTQMGSKRLFVGKAQKRVERDELLKSAQMEASLCHFQNCGCNLYVKNLDCSVDDYELQEHFSSCGKITSVKVMCEPNGFSKGFGFVCFSSPADAQRALNTLNGTILKGKSLYVALARRRKDQCKKFQDYELRLGSQPFLPSYSNARFLPTQYSFPFLPFLPTAVSQPVRFAEDSLTLSSSTHPMATADFNMNSRARSSSKPGLRRSSNRSSIPHAAAPAPPQVKSGGNLCHFLYPLVENVKPNDAGKITGMRLEMEDSAIKNLIRSSDLLSDQVNGAEQVLKEANSRRNADIRHQLMKSAGTGINRSCIL